MFYSNTTLAALDIDRLKSLFESGNSQQAWQYASSEVFAYEGDPVFDYYYGVSAIDTGHANEGVYALERVLVSQPQNHTARLELARGYFILQEYDRSRAEFERVLATEPPENVRQRIYTYLDAIRLQQGRYKTTSTAYLELGYGVDSNVNSGPSNPTITFLGQTGQLNPSVLEQRDHFTTIEGNYGITMPVTKGVQFNASINADLVKNNEHSEVDTATYTESAGLRFLHAQDAYSVSLIAQQFLVDGNDYRQLTGINTGWSRNLSQLTSLQAFFQLSDQNFDGQDARNVSAVTAGAGITKRFDAALSPVLYSSIYFAQDNPEHDSDIARQIAERDYHGVRLGAVLNTSLKTSTRITVDYQTSTYGLEDINGIRRVDDYMNAELNFTWLLSRNWSLLADASYIENDSNNSINKYDRKKAIVALRYEMK